MKSFRPTLSTLLYLLLLGALLELLASTFLTRRGALAGRAHSRLGDIAGAASDGGDQSTEGVKVEYEEDEREDHADVGHNRHSPESLEKQA